MVMFTIMLTTNNHGDVHRVIATRSLSWSKLSNRSPLAKSLIGVRRLIRANSMRVRVILGGINVDTPSGDFRFELKLFEKSFSLLTLVLLALRRKF